MGCHWLFPCPTDDNPNCYCDLLSCGPNVCCVTFGDENTLFAPYGFKPYVYRLPFGTMAEHEADPAKKAHLAQIKQAVKVSTHTRVGAAEEMARV